MPLLGFLGRWTSKAASDPVTLEPTASPRAYPSPHGRPFQPSPQGEAETRGWLSNPTSSALNSIVRARDRAGHLVSTAQRTWATSETRTWVRAPTEGNLRRILHERDVAGGAPVLSTPRFPYLREIVGEAGVELGSRGGGSIGGREPGVLQPLTPLAEEEVGVDTETRRRVGSRIGVRFRSRHSITRPPGYLLRPSRVNHPVVPGEPQEERDLEYGRRLSALPPRPSRVPGYYDDSDSPPSSSEKDEFADVEIGTALAGRVTRSQRTFFVSRPEPVPEEYFDWELASSATFSNSTPPNEEDGQDEPESEPDDIPLQRTSAREHYHSSDSDFSTDSEPWLDDMPQAFHLVQLCKAFYLPPATPRRGLESFLYRNPSALYHILTATVPNPALAAQNEYVRSSVHDEMVKDELEMHIRRVRWERISMEYVDRKERVVRKGPRVEEKVGEAPRRLREIDGMGEYIKEVRTRKIVPSKLRHCETAA